MLANRRSSERRLCRRVAKIQFGTGSLPRDCMITDVSAGGVKVIAEYPDIPAEFTIILSKAARANAGWLGGSVANSALNSSIRSKSPLNLPRPAAVRSPRTMNAAAAAPPLNLNLGLNCKHF